MKVKHILSEFEEKFSEFSNFKTHIVIPNNENPESVDVFPIINIKIDEKNKEINFCSTQFSKTKIKDNQILTLLDIVNKIKKLGYTFHEYKISSVSQKKKIDKKYSAKIDTPIIGMGPNPETNSFGFIQQFEEKSTSKKAYNKIVKSIIAKLTLLLSILGLIYFFQH